LWLRGYGVSLLVPFQSEDAQRLANWAWLKRYWRAALPGAEIVMGRDKRATSGMPFSKSAAVNDAASRASGDVFVILDADGFIDAETVLECARRIRAAVRAGRRLWYVPYRLFYRLTQEASGRLLSSEPQAPISFSLPPAVDDVLDFTGAALGHWYGAMIQVLPRESFDALGGWDERFRGWGGEDHAAMRATDTLYTLHMTMRGQVLHVWHPMLTVGGESAQYLDWRRRTWPGQSTENPNAALAGRYYGAYRDPEKMRALAGEWKAAAAPALPSKAVAGAARSI
jgi:hypothetical protein